MSVAFIGCAAERRPRDVVPVGDTSAPSTSTPSHRPITSASPAARVVEVAGDGSFVVDLGTDDGIRVDTLLATESEGELRFVGSVVNAWPTGSRAVTLASPRLQISAGQADFDGGASPTAWFGDEAVRTEGDVAMVEAEVAMVEAEDRVGDPRRVAIGVLTRSDDTQPATGYALRPVAPPPREGDLVEVLRLPFDPSATPEGSPCVDIADTEDFSAPCWFDEGRIDLDDDGSLDVVRVDGPAMGRAVLHVRLGSGGNAFVLLDGLGDLHGIAGARDLDGDGTPELLVTFETDVFFRSDVVVTSLPSGELAAVVETGETAELVGDEEGVAVALLLDVAFACTNRGIVPSIPFGTDRAPVMAIRDGRATVVGEVPAAPNASTDRRCPLTPLQ